MDNKDRTIEDTMLFAGIRKGNKKAFETLFTIYYPRLCAYAGQFVGKEDREEIVQDFMVRLWENRKKIDPERATKNYLFVSIRNRCLSHLYHTENHIRVDNLLSHTSRGLYEDPDFYVIEELSKRIEEAINALPISYREAFMMNRFEHLTYPEIADKLHVSSKTVDYRIQQALRLLRVSLKDYLPMLIF